VRHIDKDANLTSVATLSAEVRPRDEIHSILAVNQSVVGDEILTEEMLLERMPSVLDENAIFLNRHHEGSHVSTLARDAGKGKDTVQISDSVECISQVQIIGDYIILEFCDEQGFFVFDERVDVAVGVVKVPGGVIFEVCQALLGVDELNVFG
jgi:hypothetical protein